ncbi:hypothetical protein [Actinomycetospora sp. TBRC 11914]|uniref:Rv1733c family protein n=1 Tax=Actinomycetospora sp. TBRC 11914 TaxID=2729387 RepID=UPI00145E7846|nr:hypothetical protein [Actinomycetospora sp. TBRC 11914]NMO89439.1 hypothetical protein [Actinomycetospora sp. TBRC 11914]
MTGAGRRRGSAADRAYTAFVPRRSALRRPSDRWETAARWGALAVLLLLVPVVLTLGDARARAMREGAAEVRATGHPVTATVVTVSPRDAGVGAGTTVALTVAWAEPDGSVHTLPRVGYDGDDVTVGSPYPMWVDRGFRAVAPPSTEQDAVLQGWVADVGGFGAVLVTLLAGLALLRRVLDRRRLRQWEEDWAAFRRPPDRGAAG